MPAELTVAPLRALAGLVSGKVTSRKDANRPYVGLEDMRSGSAELASYSPSFMSVSTNSVFEKGDVLFGKLRPNLRKSVIAPFSGYCSTDILVLHPRPGADPRYVGHLFRSETVAAAAVRTAIGTKMPRTSWADLEDVRVFAPHIEEQRAITGVLDTVDEAIRSSELLIAKLEQMKQGVLDDLLTRGIDENGEPIGPGRFKDSPLGRIRADWDVASLRAYGSVDRPYLKTGPFGSSLKQAHWRPTGVPVITIGCLGEGVLTQSELLHVSEQTARSLAAYAVVPGDIVFSRVADVGRSAVVRESERGWIISSNLMWLSVDRRRAVPEFLQANLAGNTRVRRQIRKLVNSAGRDVANAATMNAVLFPWPPFDEQVRIAGVLRATGSRIEWERAVLLKLSLLKKGLVEDLLTGRVRLTGLVKGDAA